MDELALEKIVEKHLPKAFMGYGNKGFMCQVHFPQLCKIVKDCEVEYKQSIISLIDEMIDKLEQSRSSGRLTQIALAGVNLTIIRLQELKQKILKESEQ